MGNDLTAGYTYADTEVGREVTVDNLNQLITEAVLKETAISARTNKSTPALSDKYLISDGTLKYSTLQNIKDVLLAASSITAAMLPAGTVLQTVSAEYTSTSNITGQIPADGSTPLIGEGAQILSVSITPTTNTNKILVKFSAFGGRGSDALTVVATMWRGSTLINVCGEYHPSAATACASLNMQVLDAPASTSAQTYTIRVGGHNNDIALNGNTTTALFGTGAQPKATLTLQEIKA